MFCVQNYKNQLLAKKIVINGLKEGIHSQMQKKNYVLELRHQLLDANYQNKNSLSHFELMNRNFPNKEDVFAAVKGMVILYYAYNFNVSAMVQDGILSFIDSEGVERNFKAYEKIDYFDLENFAEHAMLKQDYALAIHITKYMYKLLPKVTRFPFNKG